MRVQEPCAHKKELAVLLLFAGLVEIRELWLFGGCNLLVWMSLVVKLKGVIIYYRV